MKVKLQPHNKLEQQSSASTLDLSKQRLIKPYKAALTDSRRAFGQDITQKCLNNNHYNFILPQQESRTINLPQYLIAKETLHVDLRPYEEEIIAYVVEQHAAFDLSKKMKTKFNKVNLRRVKVIEYMNSKCKKFKLKKKTLFLAVYYFDKYWDTKGPNMNSDKMALAAQACLLMAMKYEQIYPPFLKTWCNGSDLQEVIKTQATILQALNFKLAFTSAQHYLELYLAKRPQQSKEQILLYQCILELYLTTGQIYSDHPLKIVQEITDSFRNTLYMENQTVHATNDKKIRQLILKHQDIWDNIVKTNAPVKSKK